MNTQYGVMGTDINYMIIEEDGKMWLQVCQGKLIVKFPITRTVIAGLHFGVGNEDIKWRKTTTK